MALPATDSFTGTNGTALQTYSSNWGINAGGFVINTNAFTPASSGNECGARWTADTFSNDQYAQCVLSAKQGTSNFAAGVGVRHAAAGTQTYYGYYQDGASAGFCFKNIGGTWTQLGADFGSAAAGTTLRLEVSGTTLTVKHNGTSQGTRTDSSLSSGAAGVTGYGTSTAMRADDWEGGNLGGGSDVTVALTGQALASSAGTLAPSTSKALTGQAIASAQGSAIPALSITPTGQQLSSSAGTLAPATSKALTGQALTAAQGAVIAAFTIPLSGLVITIGQGNVSAPGGSGDVTVALTGQAIGISQGSVGPAISKALSGSALAASSGALSPSRSVALSGSVISVAQGTPVPTISKAITGQALTLSLGTVQPSTSLSLTGSLATFGQGALTPVGGVSPTVVGVKQLTVSWPDRSVTVSSGSRNARASGSRTVH